MTLEAKNQQDIRLAAPKHGARLWRNNVGGAKAVDNHGNVRYIRFGLGNDSARLNKSFKSSDLIGIRPVTITQDMVGQVIGQFMAVEVKRDDFVGRESDERYVAQRNFIECVKSLGGFAMFAKKEKDVFP